MIGAGAGDGAGAGAGAGAEARAEASNSYIRVNRKGKMKITQQQLKDWSACSDGYEWACNILKDKPMEVKKFIKITAKERLDWANWVICRVFDKPNKVRYAIFAAEQVIHLFEKKYPDDKRPREAIEAAKAWLDNPTAAYADSAASAAYAAYAASAAYAAYAAYADSAASKKTMQLKILEYGLSLLSKQ